MKLLVIFLLVSNLYYLITINILERQIIKLQIQQSDFEKYN